MHACVQSRETTKRFCQKMSAVEAEIIMKPLPLWVWVEYAAGALPRYIALNLLALTVHAIPAFRIILLNRSTLALHINMPAEFSFIPYAVAASDVARLALLAEHGGLYMDADFLVTKSLSPLRQLLTHYDTVTYEVGARIDVYIERNRMRP